MTNGRTMKQLRHCHSEPFGFAQDGLREESLILLVATGAKRKKSEMFRFAQHDRAMVAGKHEARNPTADGESVWSFDHSELFRAFDVRISSFRGCSAAAITYARSHYRRT